MLKETGVPEDLFFTFALAESGIRPEVKGEGTSARGIMQVTKAARKDAQKMSRFKKTFAARLKDPTLYYGALYMQKLAKDAGIDLHQPDRVDAALRLYMRYMMGAGNAEKFLALPEDASVGEVFSATTRGNNAAFFTVSRKTNDPRPVVRAEAERRLRERVAEAYEKYQRLQQYLRKEAEERGKN